MGTNIVDFNRRRPDARKRCLLRCILIYGFWALAESGGAWLKVRMKPPTQILYFMPCLSLSLFLSTHNSPEIDLFPQCNIHFLRDKCLRAKLLWNIIILDRNGDVCPTDCKLNYLHIPRVAFVRTQVAHIFRYIRGINECSARLCDDGHLCARRQAMRVKGRWDHFDGVVVMEEWTSR